MSMPAPNHYPTPYPAVNRILSELLENIRAVLGSHLVGMYLDGSLTSGDFDQDSDIDFVVVADEDISGDLFSALQAMHDRMSLGDSLYALELEGSYLSRHAIRRYDPEHALHPNIERGKGERLKMANHDQAWAIHRYVLHERGITLAGPSPKTLIDPVSAAELRQAMRPLFTGWLPRILDRPPSIQARGYQSYVVLSICRILYTLQTGDVTSKQQAAQWFIHHGGAQWKDLIERAWMGRHQPQLPADPVDLNLTLDFIRYALERRLQEVPPEET